MIVASSGPIGRVGKQVVVSDFGVPGCARSRLPGVMRGADGDVRGGISATRPKLITDVALRRRMRPARPHYAHCRVCEQACRHCEQACRELLGVLK